MIMCNGLLLCPLLLLEDRSSALLRSGKMAEDDVPGGLLEPNGGIGVNPFIISILL